MKKLIIFILLFITLFANAEKFKLTSVNARCTGGTWQGWQKCDIIADFDSVEHKLIIYSKIPQVFKEIHFEHISYSNYIVMKSSAKDISNSKLDIAIYLYDATQYLKLSYSNGEYVYLIE